MRQRVQLGHEPRAQQSMGWHGMDLVAPTWTVGRWRQRHQRDDDPWSMRISSLGRSRSGCLRRKSEPCWASCRMPGAVFGGMLSGEGA